MSVYKMIEITKIEIPLKINGIARNLFDCNVYPKDKKGEPKYGVYEVEGDLTFYYFVTPTMLTAISKAIIDHFDNVNKKQNIPEVQSVKNNITDNYISESTLIKAIAIAQNPTLIKDIIK